MANPTNNQSSNIGAADLGPPTRLGQPAASRWRSCSKAVGAPDAGPDFRDAVIAFPTGKLSTGDVEIHVRASDWYRHGHHNDPEYDRVILHAVYRDDLDLPVVRANGRPVETLELSTVGPITLDSPASEGSDCHRIAAELPSSALRGRSSDLATSGSWSRPADCSRI